MIARMLMGDSGWRRDVLDVAVLWTVRLGSILAVLLFASLVVQRPGRLFEPGVLLIYAAYAGMIALRFRGAMAYHGRALGFCALLLLMAVASLFSLGALPGPALVCAFVVIAAQLFLGHRAMLAALALTSLAMVAAGTSRSAQLGWPDTEGLGALFWVREAAGFAVPTAALALILAHVIESIEHSLRVAEEAMSRSRLAEAERERTKAALLKTEVALHRSQKLEALGRLAAGVGHDFNNTLQVMLSWSSILRDERDPNLIDEGIGAIEQSALAGRELTRRLLEFGRRDVRAPRRCSLAKRVGESARSLRRLLPEDIAIELDLDPSAPHVLVDPDQLAHVLLNLGLNARDAMPSGGVLRISVSSVNASDLPEEAPVSGELVCVSMRDTGVGMSAETLDHLFEPFYSTKGERGTGLGLATAHSMIERNGGFVRVSSQLGQGSTFSVYFPAQPPSAVTVESQRVLPGRNAKDVVLIAEDDPEVRRTMVRVLGSAGYRVLETADATSAMALLEQRGSEVDLLCTDGIMPGGGTRQLIDRYLACRPDGRVVVCSGYVQEELLRRDLDQGVHAYLPKPFRAAELIERIGSVLDRHQG